MKEFSTRKGLSSRRDMKGNRIFHFWLVLTLTAAGPALAVSPAIGVASAFGPFVVNSAEVQGNANLFDGSQLRTSKASSQIFLQNGAALTLGIESAGTIYRDHL